MKAMLAIGMLVLALVWSGVSWFFYWLAGAGAAVVVALTRWIGLDPSSTQWLSDGLMTAGDIARWLVAAVWLAGLIAIGLGWRFLARQLGRLEDSGRPDRADIAYPRGDVVEGEVRTRHVHDSAHDSMHDSAHDSEPPHR